MCLRCSPCKTVIHVRQQVKDTERNVLANTDRIANRAGPLVGTQSPLTHLVSIAQYTT